jgi:hypothetical protein
VPGGAYVHSESKTRGDSSRGGTDSLPRSTSLEEEDEELSLAPLYPEVWRLLTNSKGSRPGKGTWLTSIYHLLPPSLHTLSPGQG